MTSYLAMKIWPFYGSGCWSGYLPRSFVTHAFLCNSSEPFNNYVMLGRWDGFVVFHDPLCEKKGGFVGLEKRYVKVRIFLNGFFCVLFAKLRFIFHTKRPLCFRINLKKKILLNLIFTFLKRGMSHPSFASRKEWLYFKRKATWRKRGGVGWSYLAV